MSQLELAKARARAAKMQAERAKGAQDPGALDYVAQAGAGSQEGIAQMAGFPVDAVSSAISGVGEMTGLWGPIENPVGGSESIDRLLSPIRQNVPEPRNTGERFARRVGEEVGASAVAAPMALSSKAVRAAPGRFAGAEAGSAVGAGTAAATANEVAPESATAEIIAALTGGIAGGRVAGNTGRAAVKRGGIDEQRAVARDAYGRVRADQTTIPQQSVDDFLQNLQGRMAQERLNPRLQKGSSRILDALTEDAGAGRMTRVEDLEEARRLTSRALPTNASPDDRRLSQIMKGEITDYIDEVGGEAAEDLRTGRNAYRRAEAAQSVQDASTKAVRSAATTGSGGNEINRMRQKLRSIIDSPRLSRSFTAEELAEMDQIVQGTSNQNFMRRLSRFAPSSGGLSSMLGIGGALASPVVALPIMGGTEVAKMAGERSTQNAVRALMNNIAPERTLQASEPGIEDIVRALLAARTTAGGAEGGTGTTAPQGSAIRRLNRDGG